MRQAAPVIVAEPPPRPIGQQLRTLVLLALPLLFEQALNIVVGITDTYLANNVVRTGGLAGDGLAAANVTNAAAAAAVGSVTYILWLIGMTAGAIGTGATAIIARAIGARHRREANVCAGQTLLMGLVIGAFGGVLLLALAPQIAPLFGLRDPAATAYIADYLRLLGLGMPAAILLFTTNACLRGAGDTLTPAIAMSVVNVVNVIVSFGLTYGMFGLPTVGFTGIAIGTSTAYIVGGVVALVVLARGSGGLRLHLRRLLPRVAMMRRVLWIGVPAGAEGGIHWGLNFIVLRMVNSLDNVAAAAHNAAIRLESVSFLGGFAVATAAATMVGQALGRGSEHEAKRAAWLSYGLGGGLMTLMGLSYILFPRTWAGWLTDNPEITDATADVLFIAGFAQAGFASALVFGGAMRGAGATPSVMTVNLASGLLVRLPLVVLFVKVFEFGLTEVWYVLMGELALRGLLMLGLFLRGRWVTTKV